MRLLCFHSFSNGNGSPLSAYCMGVCMRLLIRCILDRVSCDWAEYSAGDAINWPALLHASMYKWQPCLEKQTYLTSDIWCHFQSLLCNTHTHTHTQSLHIPLVSIFTTVSWIDHTARLQSPSNQSQWWFCEKGEIKSRPEPVRAMSAEDVNASLRQLVWRGCFPRQEDKTEFTCIQYKVFPWSSGEEMRQRIASCTPWCKCHLDKNQFHDSFKWPGRTNGQSCPVFSTTASSLPRWVQRVRIGWFFKKVHNIIAPGNNPKVWLIDFFFLLWHCCFSFPTQHERQWNKNILAANRPHHGNSIDQPSWVLRKIYPSCQFPSINSSATTHVLNRQPWYLVSGNKNLQSLFSFPDDSFITGVKHKMTWWEPLRTKQEGG